MIFSGAIGSVPVVVTFEISRDQNGLLVYDICVETDWLVVSVAAIALVIAIILIILSDGALEPVVVPAFEGALASNMPGDAPAATAEGSPVVGAGGPAGQGAQPDGGGASIA